jgi:hypothetical protein
LYQRAFARENKDLLGDNKRARVGDDDPIRKGSRGADSDSWWPKVTAHFEAKNKEWSTDFKSPGWSK